MGQIEVYNLLHDIRKAGDDAFYTQREIKEKLQAKGMTDGALHGVWGDLRALESSGYLETKMSGRWRDWLRLYRLKAKYIHQ